jgi:RND superfamily putative drug exporter
MALLLYRLGKFSYRHRWLVISLWLAVLLAVGGAAAAFHGTLSNNFQIPGTETQRMADRLQKELPASSGGSAGVVFQANGARFSQAGKDAVSAALTKLESLPDVRGTVDPFATQAQLDQAAKDLAGGEAKAAAGKAQLDKAAAELAAGKEQLAAAEVQMAAAGLPASAIEAQLGQQKAQLAAGQSKLDAGTKALEAGDARLALAKRQVEASQGLRFVSEDSKSSSGPPSTGWTRRCARKSRTSCRRSPRPGLPHCPARRSARTSPRSSAWPRSSASPWRHWS